MPTATFALPYLRRLTATSPEHLAQQAFDYGLEATLKAQELEVEVTAERPDLLAAEGFARAMNIYNGQPRRVPAQLPASDRQIQVNAAVEPLRPFIAALVVEGVALGVEGLSALIQFQEKVSQTYGRQRQKIAIGVYDLSQIQGNLEYTALASAALTLVPLGDDRPWTGQELLSQHPTVQQYLRTLPHFDLIPVLRDQTGTILSLPPLINAAGVGAIGPDTSALFIDVTGTSFRGVQEIANILAHNFLDLQAQVKTVAIDHPQGLLISPEISPKAVPFSALRVNERVGTAIPKIDLDRYLARMDLHCNGSGEIHVPTYRTDILSDTDIAGDLLVAVGIDSLVPDQTLLRFQLGKADRLKTFALRLGDWSQRMGLTEVKSYILTDPDRLTWFGKSPIQTDNARSRTYSVTRTTLQGGLLEILSRQITAPKPVNLYEIGEVLFSTSESSAPDSAQPPAPFSPVPVSAAPVSPVQESLYWGFASLDPKASFSTAKSYIQTLLKALGLQFELQCWDDRRYIAGRAATVVIEGKAAGHFGEIHPEILAAFSFPEPVCSGELDCQILHSAEGIREGM